jgi:hypothetical protein
MLANLDDKTAMPINHVAPISLNPDPRPKRPLEKYRYATLSMILIFSFLTIRKSAFLSLFVSQLPFNG